MAALDVPSQITINDYQKAVSGSNIVSDWQYLSEGNMHIVFQYLAPDGILKSLILKINKCPDETEDIFASNYIAKRWLGDHVNDIIHPIHLSQSFVLDLVAPIQNKRPPKRRDKYPMQRMNGDPTYQRPKRRKKENAENAVYQCSLERTAFELESDENDSEPTDTDHDAIEQKHDDSEGSIFTVDIKPKWMFLDQSPFISDHHIKRSLCRFSMHQMFKLNVDKSIDSLSAFCPLSLLSNDRKIIELNLKRLLIANQSNFKLFHQNTIISSYKNIDASRIINGASGIILKHHDLLHRISMLQRLDRFGIAVVHRMWMELKTKKKLKDIESALNDKHFLDEILNRLQTEYEKMEIGKEQCFCGALDKLNQFNGKDGINDGFKGDVDGVIAGLKVEQMTVYIIEYLLAAVFKDCQILVTFDLENCDDHRISVVDLNMKPMERIEAKWLQQDQSIVEHAIDQITK